MALERSDDRVIAGVCGGIAERLGWPASRVRWICAVLTVATGIAPGLMIYPILWILIPARDSTVRPGPATRLRLILILIGILGLCFSPFLFLLMR